MECILFKDISANFAHYIYKASTNTSRAKQLKKVPVLLSVRR